MTNREYLATLTSYELAEWAIHSHPYNLKVMSAWEVGSSCISRVDAVAKWLDEEYHELNRSF